LVQGVGDGHLDSFLGIPYAAPPVGDLRWKPPVDAPGWAGVRDAIRTASDCAQPGGGASVDGSEDCLYLNIYRPANAAPEAALPVLIFIHGGGNQQGSGSSYHPYEWVTNNGIIVVTINYRLNVFGFLALPSLDAEAGEPSSGNFGLMDQQAAIRWVNANIAAFGGDPLNITIGGESAGGIDVCANLVSPTAAGLFHRAIMESMYCPTTSHDDAIQAATRIATSAGCPDTQTAAACMRSKSAADLFAATGHFSVAGEPGYNAGPNFGNSVLPLQASDALSSGQWNQSSILIGSNHDEVSSFVTDALDAAKIQFPLSVQDYQKVVAAQFGTFAPAVLREYPLAGYSDPFLAYSDEVTDDSPLGCPVTSVSQQFAAATQTFRYEFNDQSAPMQGGSPPNRTFGAYHGAELLDLFTVSQAQAPKTAAERQLSQQMMQYWTNFARTGNPNGNGLVVWPPYDTATHQLLSLKPDGTPSSTISMSITIAHSGLLLLAHPFRNNRMTLIGKLSSSCFQVDTAFIGLQSKIRLLS
jgi:para-nitrobenzyl esterase